VMEPQPKEKEIQVLLRVPDSIHFRLKHLAVDRRTTIRALIAEFIKQGLEGGEADKK
jgi:hypothetical protein